MRKATIALAGTAVGLGTVLTYQPVFGADDTTITLEPVVTATPTPTPPDHTLLASWKEVPVDETAIGDWFEGPVVRVQWGDVQVKVRIDGTTITDVQALTMPESDRYTSGLSTQVASTLRFEVLQAQSADVDMISGATYSSTAYLDSLQSALDKAGYTPPVAPAASVTPTPRVTLTAAS
jgi:uncharacterized protein with FMN-binding domain